MHEASLSCWWMVRNDTAPLHSFPFPFLYSHREKTQFICLMLSLNLQVCVNFASLCECKGRGSWMSQHRFYLSVNPCPDSTEMATKRDWFPYLIYWAIWKEAVQESKENLDVTVAWLSRNSFPSVLSSALQRLLQGVQVSFLFIRNY